MPQEDIKVTTSVQTLVEDTLSSQQERHGGDLAEIGWVATIQSRQNSNSNWHWSPFVKNELATPKTITSWFSYSFWSILGSAQAVLFEWPALKENTAGIQIGNSLRIFEDAGNDVDCEQRRWRDIFPDSEWLATNLAVRSSVKRLVFEVLSEQENITGFPEYLRHLELLLYVEVQHILQALKQN